MVICVMGPSDPVILFVRAYLPMRAGAACITGTVCDYGAEADVNIKHH